MPASDTADREAMTLFTKMGPVACGANENLLVAYPPHGPLSPRGGGDDESSVVGYTSIVTAYFHLARPIPD